jgi:hypothetical protein
MSVARRPRQTRPSAWVDLAWSAGFLVSVITIILLTR